MTVTKIATVTFRIKPEIKAALRDAADQEQRSLANMLEVMIRDYSCRYTNSHSINSKPSKPN
ncbi:hypothetical protein CKO09_11825 [Chromatium weissei]|nr:hypothetical protein [Chromatium weissei]